jgi:hypothetical protein
MSGRRHLCDRASAARARPHVWAVHVTNGANQTVADIYGRAGDGLRQNINGLPIDDGGRHVWLRRHLWRVHSWARTSPLPPTSCIERTSSMEHTSCMDDAFAWDARHACAPASTSSAVAGIYGDASNENRRNISGLPIDAKHRHLCCRAHPSATTNIAFAPRHFAFTGGYLLLCRNISSLSP